jgi:uncharacterized membrane protein YsdA (DUF1294 family)
MPRFGWIVVLVCGGLAAVFGLVLALKGFPALPAALVGLNLATILGYGCDKHQARVGGWRLPEMSLHVLAAIGGTPGAFIGQRLFHHKTRDRKFQIIFWSIAAAQVLVLLVFANLHVR